MTAFAFLVVLIFLLLFLFRRLYPADKTPTLQDASFKEDRLAAVIAPELMEALLARAHAEGRSAVEIVNDLVRAAVAPSEASEDPPT